MSNSLRKALNLLFIVSDNAGSEGLAIKELAHLSGLTPSTVHRFLQVFKEYDLIEQNESTQNYGLGSQLLFLGLKVKGMLDIRKVALPVLKELSNETKEDSCLAVAKGDQGVHIERVEGPYPTKAIETYGTQIPLHCGAARRVLLSFKDDEWIKGYIQRGLKSYTENTIIEPEKLLNEIEKIRKEGYAVSRSEYIEYACGVFAPVRDYTGEVLASIGIICLNMRFTPDRVQELIGKTKTASKKLSKKLGYID